MALVVKDRVRVTTTTTGTSDFSLGSAVTGYQSFNVIGNNNTTYYVAADPATGDWEVGVGTFLSSGPTLTRDTILESSNAGSKVVFAAGAKDLFVSYPAERAVYLSAAGLAVDVLDIGTLGTSTANISNANITAGTVSTTPSSATDIANKSYVDTIASSGITYHTPVKYEVPNTTGNLNATYNNGASGVGATLTNAGTKAAFAPDGPTAQVGDRILIYNQTNAYENGIYEVTTVGTPDPGGTNWVLTRTADADSYAVKDPNALGNGDAFFITSGNTGAGETYVCNTVGTITFGTTAITFAQISDATLYTAGTGLTLTGVQFSITPVGTAGTYGSASQVPVIVTNASGQVSSVTNTAIAITAGAVSGLAASATTDTTNAANITSGTLNSARLSGSYTGITGVGTLTAGTWNAGTIGVSYGGTGLTSYAVGDLLYADTTTSLAKLADVVVGNALISGGVGTAPSWGKIGLTTHVSGTLGVANGGTGAATLTGYVYGNGTGAFTASTSIPNSATTATSANTASAIVARDASGNFSAGTITATLSGNASTATSATTATNLAGGSVGTIPYQSAAATTAMLAVGTSGQYLKSNGAAAPSWDNLPAVNNGTLTMNVSGTGLSGSATFTANQSGNSTFTVSSNATSANTANAIVARDVSGNFSAGTITATLSGNATSATTSTNLAGGSAGTIPYQSAAGTTAMLAAGTAGYYLQSNGASAPSWIAPPTIGNGTLTMNVSGNGLSGSQTFTANQSSNAIYTVSSNATAANTASTIVFRDGSGDFSAGTITAALSGNASTSSDSSAVNGISAVNLYNNMGQTHSTRTAFDATTPSYGFGYRFVQGSTNGPGTGGTQFYSWYIGLGSDYLATGANSYGAMFAVDRNSSTPYLSVRFNEGNTFTSWYKIRAGYADSAGNVNNGTLTMNVSGTGLSGSATFTANQSGNSTFTVTSNATSANTASTIVARDASGNFTAGIVTTTWGGYALPNTGASSQWIYLGRWSGMTQAGAKLQIKIVSASGYNASIAQNCLTEIYFKTSNGSSFQAGSTGNFFADGQAWRTGPNNTTPSTIRVLQANTTTYDVYGNFASYTGDNSFYTVSVANGAWTNYSTTSITPGGNYIDLPIYQVLDSNNYNTYAPTLTGTGASGTWGINITGNAATATTASNVNNGTLTLATSGTGISGSATFTANQSGNSTFTVTSNATSTNTTGAIVSRDASGNFAAGDGTFNSARVGNWAADANYKGLYHSGMTGVEYVAITASTDKNTYISSWTSGTVFIRGGGNVSTFEIRVSGSSRPTVAGNIILDAGNYNSYSPTLTGTGASGTWGINITGSAGSAGAANALSNVGYGSTQLTWYQTSGNFQTWTGGWASHLVSNHGDGSTYYNQILIMPFWGPPQYMRKEGGSNVGPYTFITTENSSTYIGNGTLTMNVSGNGLSGSQTFTANQSSAATFTVTSNATSANTASTIVFRDASGNFSANAVTIASDSTISTLTIGRGAGSQPSNTALGVNALFSNTTGFSNTAVGNGALVSNTTSNSSTAIGNDAMYNMRGDSNTAIGRQAMLGSLTPANNTGSNNVAVGFFAARTITSGNQNTALGTNSLRNVTTGSNNVGVGGETLYNISSQINNVAVGFQTLYYMGGTANIGIGYLAMVGSTTPANNFGSYNIALGQEALAGVTSGSYNIAIGYQALDANTTASSNVAIGTSTLGLATTATQNVAVGSAALAATTGSQNTAIGESAGTSITTGSKNTIIGRYTGNQGGLNIATLSNYIVLSDGDGNPRGYFDNNGNYIVGADIRSTSLNGGQMTGFRNMVINGGMVIDQRNNGAAVVYTAATQTYVVDRFGCYGTLAGRFTIQRNQGSVTPPAGFSNYLGVTSSAATVPGATDLYALFHKIEGFNFSRASFGTANAQSLILSFWVRSSLTGTFGGGCFNSAANRNYVFSYTISAANTWERKSITIPGDTTGTWLTDNGVGFQWWTDLGSGSSNRGTAGSWTTNVFYGVTGGVNVVGTSGATFYITGVQLEVGTAVTPFENRSIGTEAALCQRYYSKNSNLEVVANNGDSYFDAGKFNAYIASAYSSAQAYGQFVNFPVTMRAAPTIVYIRTNLSATTNGMWNIFDIGPGAWESPSTFSTQSVTANGFNVALTGSFTAGAMPMYGGWTASIEL